MRRLVTRLPNRGEKTRPVSAFVRLPMLIPETWTAPYPFWYSERVRTDKLTTTPTKKEFEMIIRRSECNAPVTQEEIAWQLFTTISEGAEKIPQEQVLPLFAKCMLAVKDPKEFLGKADITYNINLPQN